MLLPFSNRQQYSKQWQAFGELITNHRDFQKRGTRRKKSKYYVLDKIARKLIVLV